MKVNRFTKLQYNTLDKSLFHQWLKEEGYSRYGLAIDLGKTEATIDRYMNEPERLTIKQVKIISEETGVDANFIFSLIYEN